MRVAISVIVSMLACPLTALAQTRASFVLADSDHRPAVSASFDQQSSRQSSDPAPAIAPNRRPGVLTGYLPVFASSLDLGSTISLLRGGGHEQNPILGKSIARITVTKAALTGLLVYALHRASPVHPRATKWIGIGATAAFSAASIKNLKRG